MAVGAPGVHIEEINQIELAQTKLDAARGQGGCEMQRVAVRFDAILRQRDDLAQHEPRKVGRLGQRYAIRQPHGVQVGVAGQAVRIPDAAARGILHIGEDFRCGGELVAGVERHHVRGCALRP